MQFFWWCVCRAEVHQWCHGWVRQCHRPPETETRIVFQGRTEQVRAEIASFYEISSNLCYIVQQTLHHATLPEHYWTCVLWFFCISKLLCREKRNIHDLDIIYNWWQPSQVEFRSAFTWYLIRNWRLFEFAERTWPTRSPVTFMKIWIAAHWDCLKFWWSKIRLVMVINTDQLNTQ